MRLDSLKHITRAVAAMLDGDRVVVFGSASLLASFPELGDLEGSPLQQTYDADLIPYPFEESVGMMLDEAFGEDRGFHQRFGYHADIVRPKVTETFPEKWEERLLPLAGTDSVFCVEPHDMAAAKCLVGREKDRKQLSFLLSHNYLQADLLEKRVGEILLSSKVSIKAHRFLASLTDIG